MEEIGHKVKGITEEDNEIQIAGELTIWKWKELKLKLDPAKDENWDNAFEFFKKRMKTRYIKPIKAIQNLKLMQGEGFAMVNLQCSLIETIESFYNGWIYKNDKEDKPRNVYYLRKIEGEPLKWEDGTNLKNENIFMSFFRKRKPLNDKIDGSDFYLNVRCALLHETQTKNGWIIKGESLIAKVFFEEIGEMKVLYRTNFQKAIQKVIKDYKKAIIGDKALNRVELRKNFIAKVDRICELSELKP